MQAVRQAAGIASVVRAVAPEDPVHRRRPAARERENDVVNRTDELGLDDSVVLVADEPTDRPSPEDGGEPSQQELPVWFERILIVAVAGVVSFGGAGLALADRGQYSFGLAAALGGVGTAFGLIVALRYRGTGSAPKSASIPAVAMILVTLALAAWNGTHVGYHLGVNRDPGVYNVAGKWIAENGTVVVHAGSTWADTAAGYGFTGAGMYSVGHGDLEFQFTHMYPVLLAEANGVGGDALMFRTGSVLSALALCLVFAVGCRLIRRPWIVLAAVAGLGVSMPQVYFIRDTYSEPSTQVLLWGGIWLLLLARQRLSPGVGLLAGAALGGTVMTRIDAVAYLIFVPLLGAVAWLTCPTSQRRRLLAVMGSVVAGAVPPVLLGTLDVQRRAGTYYHDLRGYVVSLYKAELAVAIASVLLVVVWPRLHRVRVFAAQHRDQLAITAGSLVGAGLLFMWLVRSMVQTARWPNPGGSTPVKNLVGSLQKRAGVTVDKTRSYSEQTMHWLTWYMGPITVALAIIGIVALTLRVVRRPTPVITPAAAVVLAIAGTLTAAYLWSPNITPDQIWATRRFVPASLPLISIAAAVALGAVLDAIRRYGPPGGHTRALRRGVAAAGCAALVAGPLATTWPVRNMEVDANYYPLITRLCDTVGPHAAVVFSAVGAPRGAAGFAQTVRSYCNVPVASRTRPYTQQTAAAAVAAWQAQSRVLWVVSTTQAALVAALPGAAGTLVGQAKSTHDLEMTLIRAPDEYTTQTLKMYAAKMG
jgi:hypothetical protein